MQDLPASTVQPLPYGNSFHPHRYQANQTQCGNCVDGIGQSASVAPDSSLSLTSVDHHCSYIHTCVGKSNYLSFIVLLISSVRLPISKPSSLELICCWCRLDHCKHLHRCILSNPLLHALSSRPHLLRNSASSQFWSGCELPARRTSLAGHVFPALLSHPGKPSSFDTGFNRERGIR